MQHTTIFNSNANLSQSKDNGCQNMIRQSKNYISELISEYGEYDSDKYAITFDINQLDFAEKKILLSYIIDLDEYEYVVKNNYKLYRTIKRYEDEMQDAIDAVGEEKYQEAMEEMGSVLRMHKDNGEYYWSAY